MNRGLFPPIFPFFAILIFISIHIPESLCARDDEQYTNCSSSYKCGNIRITYPFWGAAFRPDYCGYPGFELACQSDVLTITISATSYRVLSIDNSTQALTVVRQDYWGTYCPTLSLANSTLDSNIFSYGSTSQYLSLYYGCPEAIMGLTNQQYSCDITAGGNSTGYYLTRELNATELALATSLQSCNDSVQVSVFESAIKTLNGSPTLVNLVAAIDDGFGLKWAANNSLCDACDQSGGQCGYSVTSGEFACYCKNKPYASTCGSIPLNRPGSSPELRLPLKYIVGMSAVIAVIIVVFMKICCVRIECKLHIASIFRTIDHDMDAFIRNCGSLAPKQYKYSDVKKMTDSFTEKLGQGGYGCVYKGKLSDGRLVAVKILSESKGSGEEFLNEVISIGRTSHVNVVNLVGFCYERTKRALIYEFMHNGSLDRFIYGEQSWNTNSHLEWRTLYRIAVGIAQGLDYLHSGCNTRILHFDIKPHNILLDEDFHPKISDFGLAKLCQRKDSVISMLGTRGTIGYIAPELFSRVFGGVSHKSDVYSYGMMILQMVGGGEKIDAGASQKSDIYFPDWIYEQLKTGMELKLERVVTEGEEELARKMILVGLWCIQTKPSDRPSMSNVVEMLEGSIQSLQIPPKPFLSSPPRSPQHYSSTFSTLS